MRTPESVWSVLKVHGKTAAAIVVLATVSACASIPVSTMWKLRNFDASDLERVQPEQLRLAGKVDPAPMTIDPARSHLSLTLKPREDGARDVKYTFGLRATNLHHPQLVSDADPRWQVFELDQKGLAAWKRLQPELADLKTNYQSAEFKFKFKTVGETPAGTDAWIASARLQLGPAQQPLTLMDRARIRLD